VRPQGRAECREKGCLGPGPGGGGRKGRKGEKGLWRSAGERRDFGAQRGLWCSARGRGPQGAPWWSLGSRGPKTLPTKLPTRFEIRGFGRAEGVKVTPNNTYLRYPARGTPPRTRVRTRLGFGRSRLGLNGVLPSQAWLGTRSGFWDRIPGFGTSSGILGPTWLGRTRLGLGGPGPRGWDQIPGFGMNPGGCGQILGFGSALFVLTGVWLFGSVFGGF